MVGRTQQVGITFNFEYKNAVITLSNIYIIKTQRKTLTATPNCNFEDKKKPLEMLNLICGTII